MIFPKASIHSCVRNISDALDATDVYEVRRQYYGRFPDIHSQVLLGGNKVPSLPVPEIAPLEKRLEGKDHRDTVRLLIGFR